MTILLRRCSCGTPVGPLQKWCSQRCFYEDEPGAHEREDIATQDEERDF